MLLGLFVKSIKIFSFKDRMKIISITLIQILLNFLDLAGVIIIGLLGALAINGTSSRPPGDRVQRVLDFLSLGDSGLQWQVTVLALMAAGMLILKTILSVYFTRKILFFLNYKSALMTNTLVEGIFSESIIELNKNTRQENLNLMTGGVASVVNGIIYNSISIFTDLTLLIILLVGLFFAEPTISLAALFFFGGTAYFLYLSLRHRNLRLNNERFAITAKNGGLILEFMNSFREAIVSNRKNYYLKEIGSIQYSLARNTAEMSFLPNISKYILEIAIILGSIIISAIQFSQSNASRSVAVLAIFLASSTRMVPAILRIQQSALQIRGSRDVATLTLRKLAGMKVMHDFNVEMPEFNCNHREFKPIIQVSNVGFKYPDNSDFEMKHLNFEIKFGDVIAIVGPSGGGKSTLVDLMLGILPANEGQVYYDSLTPSQAISKFPGSIAYVPQDIQIINGTLRENIGLGYGLSKIDSTQYEKVLEIAQLKEFVSNLNQGLDTQMGEMGSNLSGGQKQRIGIARALITDPRVIVLDEATSALDNDTENEFKQALMKLKRQATIIIIAHRLSTVTEADQIIYIEKGNLIASGTLNAVMETVPVFKKNLNSILS